MVTILYLYHVSSIGGGSYCLLNILSKLDRNIYKPLVLLKNDGPLIKELKKLNIEVYTLSSITQVPYNRSLCKYSSLKAYFNIATSMSCFKKWLHGRGIDIVYVNSMMLYPYLKVVKELNIKTIIHIRENWPTNENVIQLKWAQRAIEKYADYVVAINESSASLVPFMKDRTEIVYDWIDFTNRNKTISYNEIFNEECSNLKVYLYLGGIQRIKGAYQVLDVFVNYLKDENCRLLFLGYNGIKKRTKLKNLLFKFLSILGIDFYYNKVVDLINSDSRIRCIKSQYEIKNIIEQAYCILSYFTIPHANLSLAESIILKKPVIAALTKESLEYSLNGKLACLYEINNIDDFIDKINGLNNNYDEIIGNINKYSNLIEKMFNPEINSNKLLEVYKKVLDSNNINIS